MKKKLFAVVVFLCALFVAYAMFFIPSKAVLAPNEVPIFITIGQSNANGSSFASNAEDQRLRAWYDDSVVNPHLMKIWYRSSYIVNQENGAC